MSEHINSLEGIFGPCLGLDPHRPKRFVCKCGTLKRFVDKKQAEAAGWSNIQRPHSLLMNFDYGGSCPDCQEGTDE